MIKRLLCWMRAIPLFFRCGEWVPHTYTCEYEKTIIVAGEDYFRSQKGYEHAPGERVYQDACLITYTCKDCGHKSYGWYPSWEQRWKLEE